MIELNFSGFQFCSRCKW